MDKILRYLPRGNTLEDEAWKKRHHVVLWVLAAHLPALLLFGIIMGSGLKVLVECLAVPAICLGLGFLVRGRRSASIIVTAGLTWCSAALVVLSGGTIEAHFHFFIILGFIALYQDWVPFLWNIVFTVISHGVGSAIPSVKIFNHPAALAHPWLWSGIHGVAVLFACVGLVIFWRVSEEDQQARARLAQRLAEAEIGRRRFTSDLLINLARRNQSMLYRQLDIINQLEEKERDPDALAELFRLDHLATRIRRNAESLMVLSGETPARVWSAPVPLRAVVQAAIAETEDLNRVRFTVDERLAVAGHIVTDLTHLLAELAENAVRFSPPDSNVTISSRVLPQRDGAQLLTIEDWGVGMRPDRIRETNQLLAHPPEVDLSVSQRLGFHVVARLAKRHKIEVSLTPTPGSGVTAVIVLPAELFAAGPAEESTAWGSAGPALAAAYPGIPVQRSIISAEPNGMWRPPMPAAPSNGNGWRRAAATAIDGPASWDGWWRAPDYAQQSDEPAQRSGSGTADDVGGPTENGGPPDEQPPDEQPLVDQPLGDQSADDQPSAVDQATDQPISAGPGRLNRRRPQTHLAPELLRPSPQRPQPRVVPDPRPASEALSRYQASRQAAQVEADKRGFGSQNGEA